ncbi:leucyl aminopeptidase [Phytomonospora endophytica]|uniref:Probable cytosol aminopeptidase n=1 Tax=Phytomonospora endophytica TaxID=714109 RepID=A0A841FNC0_9ACTN|nr:leucyl aminopeptidase [Phytomonospora endophytica]MBB6034717.1 leucyl aminopeptidase [Phytomonospora endophytica]GIG69080.1 putative cytosol aminopeptidase [Phytomonospora endophytica]
MTDLTLTTADATALGVDVLVIGLHSGDELTLAPGAEAVDAAFDGALSSTLELLGASGAVGEVTRFASLGKVTAPVVAAVGLGPVPEDGESVKAESLRRAAGSVARSATGRESVALVLSTDGDEGASLAEGALLGAYRFAGYKSETDEKSLPVKTVTLVGSNADVARATAIADAVARCRDWVNTPANLLRPPGFAELASAAATEAGLEVEVLDEHALEAGGYGGILAVGNGSDAKPRLVRIAYRTPGAAKHVALVGKGITFDTGGISIKPPQGMWDMKTDMGGAAAVITTILAVAALKPNVNVTAYAAMAENMLSGSSYRPGDVVTAYGGKTIEVLNTDAEGRMVLCDAIVRAGEDDPDFLYETSTLTGGQVIGLGKRTSGVMGDETECARVKAAGERVGELMWPMPFPEEIHKIMDSPIADTSQVAQGMDRAGHMLQAGIFLSRFVKEGLPWAHIDIAGPSGHAGEPYGYIPKGATGVPVRTLLALIEEHAAAE